jgi:hypothetical protein
MRRIWYIFQAAISGDTLRIAGFTYMDNKDVTQSTTPTVTTAEEGFIQEGLNTWEGPVRARGGALSNDKSCWWYIDFTFDHKGDWRYKKMEELEGDLTAIDIDGRDVVQSVVRIVSGKVFGWCLSSSQWLSQNCRPPVTCEAFVQRFSP